MKPKKEAIGLSNLSITLFFIIQFILFVSSEDTVVFREILKDNTESIVIKNKVSDIQFSEINDFFFEILNPSDISYTYRVRAARDIGSSFTNELKKKRLIISDPLTACTELSDKKLKGHVALIKRGECSFITKLIRAEKAGAKAAIIFDNNPDTNGLVDMIGDGSTETTNLPSVFMSYKDGVMIKKSIESYSLQFATINIPLNVTFIQEKRLKRAPWSYW